MRKMIINRDLVEITNDFTLGVILTEIIEISKRYRKEFIENKWHCPEFFEMDILKISEDNKLNLSKTSMRRYIKKLENLGFISIDKLEKKHRYRVNFANINRELEKIGAETLQKNDINKIDDLSKNDIKNIDTPKNNKNYLNKTVQNECKTFEDKSIKYNQDEKIAPSEETELINIQNMIKYNIDYTVVEHMRQERNNENFVNLFDKVYNIIVDAMTTKSDYIKINKELKPVSVVKNIFSKLQFGDIAEVIDKISTVPHKIINYTNYIRTSLYNQYLESDMKLSNIIYNDMGIKITNCIGYRNNYAK